MNPPKYFHLHTINNYNYLWARLTKDCLPLPSVEGRLRPRYGTYNFKKLPYHIYLHQVFVGSHAYKATCVTDSKCSNAVVLKALLIIVILSQSLGYEGFSFLYMKYITKGNSKT